MESLKTSEDTEKSARLHKSCCEAVAKNGDDRQWYVAVTKPRYEMICRDQVDLMCLDAYVAAQEEVHVYKNRSRRTTHHIVIPKILFVRVNEKERLEILKKCPAVLRFMTNPAAKRNEYGGKLFAVIPDRQMQQLRYALYQTDSPAHFTDVPLRLGDRIRVARGSLVGLEGRVMRDGNSTYIVVSIDQLGSVMVSIPPADIERI